MNTEHGSRDQSATLQTEEARHANRQEIKQSHTFSTRQPPESVRIFLWNVNGIRSFLQQTISNFFSSASGSASASIPQQPSLRGFLRRHLWPPLLLLQEVKISRRDEATQNAVCAAVNKSCYLDGDGPSHTVYFTLPRDAHNARGFGGKNLWCCEYYSLRIFLTLSLVPSVSGCREAVLC
jgi:hypothetical protein